MLNYHDRTSCIFIIEQDALHTLLSSTFCFHEWISSVISQPN